MRAQDVTQRGLSQELGGAIHIHNVIDGQHWVHNTEVDNSVHMHCHTVLGENLRKDYIGSVCEGKYITVELNMAFIEPAVPFDTPRYRATIGV